jgi:hydroxyacylglutathione hydrolase
MSDVPVIPLVDVGLGNSTYPVDLGDRRALAVDPSRDLRGVQAAAAARGPRVVFRDSQCERAAPMDGAIFRGFPEQSGRTRRSSP